jgi:hypothetical protein
MTLPAPPVGLRVLDLERALVEQRDVGHDGYGLTPKERVWLDHRVIA